MSKSYRVENVSGQGMHVHLGLGNGQVEGVHMKKGEVWEEVPDYRMTQHLLDLSSGKRPKLVITENKAPKPVA